jgi:hypothetical protein
MGSMPDGRVPRRTADTSRELERVIRTMREAAMRLEALGDDRLPRLLCDDASLWEIRRRGLFPPNLRVLSNGEEEE